MSTTSKPDVKVGQIWKDNDKRMGDRRLLVRRVEGDYAYCSHKGSYGWWSERTVRILLRRFRPTSSGYKLLSEHIG